MGGEMMLDSKIEPHKSASSILRLVARNAAPLIFIAIILAALLTGCTTTKSSHCAAFDAIRPSQAQIDVMTDAEVERTLIELEKFRRICGVKP